LQTVDNENSGTQNKNSSNLAFALAHELKQYMNNNAENFEEDIWDSLNHWRSGILSQRAITEEDLGEIIGYIGAEKLQELISLALK